MWKLLSAEDEYGDYNVTSGAFIVLGCDKGHASERVEHSTFNFGVKNFDLVQTTFCLRPASFVFSEDLFFRVLRGTQRTLTGVQPLVPRYWPGYYQYHGIRTTLGQHCTAECRLALRDVFSPEAIGTFLWLSNATRVTCFLWSCCLVWFQFSPV